MSLEMFVPGERLKYWAEGVNQHGIGTLWHGTHEPWIKKNLFHKGGMYGKLKDIGRSPFQEVGNGHRGASGPIAT